MGLVTRLAQYTTQPGLDGEALPKTVETHLSARCVARRTVSQDRASLLGVRRPVDETLGCTQRTLLESRTVAHDANLLPFL